MQIDAEKEVYKWDQTTSLPELNRDEIRLVDVTLSANITGREISVDPAEIITAQEAVQLLQTGSAQQEIYTVKAGDVLGSIANTHGLSTVEILQLNPSLTATSILQIGQQLNVTVEKPYVSVKAVYEKKKIEAIDFAKEK